MLSVTVGGPYGNRLKTVQRSMKSINDVMRKIDDKPNVLIMGE